MKLYAKIVLSAMLVLSLSMALSGYLLISRSFSDALEREQTQALSQYRMSKYALQSGILTAGANWKSDKTAFRSLWMDGQDHNTHTAAVYDAEKKLLYAGSPPAFVPTVYADTDLQTVCSAVEQKGSVYYQIVSGCFEQDGELVYLATATDISAVFASKSQIQRSFVLIYCAVTAFGFALMLLLAQVIARPVRRLTDAAKQIAAGKYGESVSVRTGDEIGELADSFNSMSAQIQENIEALSLGIEQKENFVANFAHELKTPLTSVIGYADMIYQNKLSAAETRDAAGYILDEGMRLEALSLKLMDLIVLNKQDFVLESLETTEIFKNIKETLHPIFFKKQIELDISAAPAYIKVEYDLFKTMLLNLTDNAIKAGATRVSINGLSTENGYRITVSDNGCGIPQAELKRVTEAFYMVDKSRSRKQHGAGLGLALVDKIIHLHGGRIAINSVEQRGTSVVLILQREGEI